MQNENKCLEADWANRVSDLMYKLDMSSAKVEQCAFDSINTTDRIMNGMQSVMELMQQIVSQQSEINSAVEICALVLDEQEGNHLNQIVQKCAEKLSMLEIELHNIIESAAEANDAAHCIEAGVAEQSENIAELIQCNEEMIEELV